MERGDGERKRETGREGGKGRRGKEEGDWEGRGKGETGKGRGRLGGKGEGETEKGRGRLGGYVTPDGLVFN